jgi:hypothetical protein
VADYDRRRAANDRSLLNAEQHGEFWSEDEDNLLRETMNEPPADVSYVLGRSIFAVVQRRSIIRHNATQARRGTVRAHGAPCPRCTLIHPGDC